MKGILHSSLEEVNINDIGEGIEIYVPNVFGDHWCGDDIAGHGALKFQ